MTPFTTLTAMACPLPLANVDTDQIIPARFMKQPRSAGYGGFLLHDLRFAADGTPKGSSLDDPARKGAGILVARRNFGGGSSREAAVYALVDFGIRAVLAPSFGDIFSSNAVNNGLLPARVSESDAEALLATLAEGAASMTVDLRSRKATCGQVEVPFEIDPVWREKLLNGWDDLDLTMSRSAAIGSWWERDAVTRPWVTPRR